MTRSVTNETSFEFGILGTIPSFVSAIIAGEALVVLGDGEPLHDDPLRHRIRCAIQIDVRRTSAITAEFDLARSWCGELRAHDVARRVTDKAANVLERIRIGDFRNAFVKEVFVRAAAHTVNDLYAFLRLAVRRSVAGDVTSWTEHR